MEKYANKYFLGHDTRVMQYSIESLTSAKIQLNANLPQSVIKGD